MGFVWRADSLAPLRSLARARALREALDDTRPLALALACFNDDARILGRWIVDGEGPRRASGGPTILAPAGTLHVALALLDRSLLLDTPADKLLNRNVRGILRGLGAQYFGRELISLGPAPIGVVGWARDAQRRVLIEAFIAVDRPIELLTCEPARDPLRGRTPSCLRAAGRHDALALLFDRLVDAHAGLGRGARFDVSHAFVEQPDPEAPSEVDWAATVDGAIGRVQLGRERDGTLRLGGEAFADDDLCAWLDNEWLRGHGSEAMTANALAEGRIEGLNEVELRSLLDQLDRGDDH